MLGYWSDDSYSFFTFFYNIYIYIYVFHTPLTHYTFSTHAPMHNTHTVICCPVTAAFTLPRKLPASAALGGLAARLASAGLGLGMGLPAPPTAAEPRPGACDAGRERCQGTACRSKERRKRFMCESSRSAASCARLHMTFLSVFSSVLHSSLSLSLPLSLCFLLLWLTPCHGMLLLGVSPPVTSWLPSLLVSSPHIGLPRPPPPSASLRQARFRV